MLEIEGFLYTRYKSLLLFMQGKERNKQALLIYVLVSCNEGSIFICYYRIVWTNFILKFEGIHNEL